MYGFVRKLRISLFLACLVSLVTSTIFVYYFVQIDDYTSFELRHFISYFLSHQVNSHLFWASLLAVGFTIGWFFYRRLEGLLFAGVLILSVMVPLAFYVNRNLLPGIRQPESLVGNGIICLLTAAGFLLLYFKQTRDWQILHRLYSTKVFTLLILIIVGINTAYYIKPQHQRLEKSPTVFGEEFLQLFRFSENHAGNGPGLNKRAFLRHFEQKTDSVIVEVRDRIKRLYPDTTKIIRTANDILARKFDLWDVTKQLPQTFDWYENPTDDDVWGFALNEFEWMWEVMAAYVMTRDERYARDFQTLMASFFNQVSLIDWKDERDPVWRLIGVGLRLSDSWVDAFYVFLHSPSVSDDVKIKMLAYIHDQANFLFHFRSPRWNHLIQESYGLLKVGVMFPEFKMAAEWLEMAKYRLERDISMDVYPDGGYTEASIYYHRYVVRLFQRIMDYTDWHKVRLSEEFYQRFEEMYTFMMYTTWPDGRMPAANDGFHAKKLHPLYHAPAEKFHRDDFRWFATEGIEGTQPDVTSMAFPYTGFYVMRSDWSPAARYAILDAGLFGSAHGHEDKLNFEIVAFGTPFIVEAGTFTYVYNEWHRYFESSFAHNTIVVDGRSQLRQPEPDKWATDPHRKLPNIWVSNDHFDYVEATYNEGYGNNKEDVHHDVRHTRRLLFVKPDYWILWDVLAGEGEHQYEQLFHFVPTKIAVDTTDLSCRTMNDRPAHLLLYPLYRDGLSVEVKQGETDPIQGWYSPKYGEKVPAPVVVYSKSGGTPTHFVNVIMPFESEINGQGVDIESVPVELDGSALAPTAGIALQVLHRNGKDTIMIVPAAGTKVVATDTTRKNIMLVRRDREGKVLAHYDAEF